jgi:hypothetical protein
MLNHAGMLLLVLQQGTDLRICLPACLFLAAAAGGIMPGRGMVMAPGQMMGVGNPLGPRGYPPGGPGVGRPPGMMGGVPILPGGLNLLGGGGGFPGGPGGPPGGPEGMNPMLQQQLLLQQNPAFMQALLAQRQQQQQQQGGPMHGPPGSAPMPGPQ